ncbi:MAG: 3-phosphoshikimate 1-carboxyvinyltransferase [Desulfatibacillaceae bacterium]
MDKSIQPIGMSRADARVPGSKSYTHRMLICASLAGGESVVRRGLVSQDTLLTIEGLQRMGATIRREDKDYFVTGTGGRLAPCAEPIDLHNSGTSMRLLTAVAALGTGIYTLTGSRRMQERPIGHLVDALAMLGVPVRALSPKSCPPVEVQGGHISGSAVDIDCSVSSQYLSGLLLIAPLTEKGMEINVLKGPVSRPYLDMTLDVMERFGATLERDGYTRFSVPGGQAYSPGEYQVDADASAASYFFGAAAITKTAIRVRGTRLDSVQGDIRLCGVLERMGCAVRQTEDGVEVTGGPLKAATVDMGDIPDMVPTLAVVAAFAEGTTIIENVAHLRAKESDRLGCVVQELTEMGVRAHCTEDRLLIQGGRPHGAAITTHDDHRLAMAFAMAGLVVPHMVIKDAGCVEKSFPNFWEEFEKLYGED